MSVVWIPWTGSYPSSLKTFKSTMQVLQVKGSPLQARTIWGRCEVWRCSTSRNSVCWEVLVRWVFLRLRVSCRCRRRSNRKWMKTCQCRKRFWWRNKMRRNCWSRRTSLTKWITPASLLQSSLEYPGSMSTNEKRIKKSPNTDSGIILLPLAVTPITIITCPLNNLSPPLLKTNTQQKSSQK